ncbi:MAG TPA: DUF6538 domain-containing protein [Rhizomicrobium sp.]
MDFIQRSKHGTVYHFRRRVPKDLTAYWARDQIVVSLRTESRDLAVRRARVLLLATDNLFSDLRQMPKPTKPKTIRIDYGLEVQFDPLSGILKSVRVSDASQKTNRRSTDICNPFGKIRRPRCDTR